MKIPFLNVDVKKHRDDTYEVSKAFIESLVSTDLAIGPRPTLDPYTDGMGGDYARLRLTPLPLQLLYDVAWMSDTLRTINKSIVREVFKNGLEVKAKFAMKCEVCGKEFDTQVDVCDECGEAQLREPKNEERLKLEKFIKSVNENDQSMLDLSKQLENDFQIADDVFLVAVKDYYTDKETGKIREARVRELIRGDPKFFEIIADISGRPGFMQDGTPVRICPLHRETPSSGKDGGAVPTGERCGVCGRALEPAYYRSRTPNVPYTYFLKDEVCHASKYTPSLTYGISPVLSVWVKVSTLINQDTYMMKYYGKGRPPTGLLAIKTGNVESTEKWWKWMLDEFRRNPHQVPPLMVEDHGQGSGGKFVEFVNFMKTMEEMQFTETREEFRRTIGAVYGVMPIFQADLKGAGGLNNEGLQVTVTNRAITEGQDAYNSKLYPWACRQLDVNDFELIVEPNEQEDESRDVELFGKKIDNALKMQQLGFTVTLNDDQEFEYGPLDEPVGQQQPGMGAPMGEAYPPSFGQDPQAPPQEMSTGAPPTPEGFDGGIGKAAPTLQELIPEHKKLIRVLEHGTPAERKRLLADQKGELKEYEREAEE